jgi:hypothetical protein
MNLVEEELVPAARRCSDLLFRPTLAFREIREEPLVQAVIWYGVLLPSSILMVVVIGLVYFGVLDTTRPGLYSPFGMGAFVSQGALLFLWLAAGMLAFGIVYHILIYVCGGREGIRRTLAVVLYAATPVLLVSWIAECLWLFRMPQAATFLFLASVLWAVVLAVIGTREAHGLSTSRAVLPLVLLVAILAAAFLVLMLFSMGDQCGGCSRITAVTAACTNDTVTVTYQGGQDAQYVINISAYDTDVAGTRVMGGTDGILPVGSVLVLPGPLYSPAHVIAIASYTDGTLQVILDQNMKCGENPGKTRTPATPTAVSSTTKPVPSAIETIRVTITPEKPLVFQQVYAPGCWGGNTTIRYCYALDTGKPSGTGPAAPAQNGLARAALAREDIPFAVMTERNGTLQAPAAISPENPYGILLVHDVSYYEGTGGSETERTVQQVIYRFPEGNAEKAWYDFRQTMMQASDPESEIPHIVWGSPVAVGNRTMAFYVRYINSSTPRFTDTVVVFTQGEILEIISMRSRDPELAAAGTLAKKAASYLPDGRPAVTVTPARTGIEKAGLETVFPSRATALSTSQVGKLSFTLRTGSGDLPLGAGKTRFWVYLPSGGGDKSFYTGEKTVTVIWKKAVGEKNDILDPGEEATIELDLASAGFAQDVATINHGMGIMVMGPSDTLAFSCGNLPATLVPGTTYDCW